MWAFAIGAAVGGLSGALFAGQVGFVNNQKFDVQTSILFLAAVVLGGTGNKVGALLGGAIVAYIPLRFTAIADYKYLIFGVALVVLMIFRAKGLVPAKQRLLAYGRHAYEYLVSKPATSTGDAAARRNAGRRRDPHRDRHRPEGRRIMTDADDDGRDAARPRRRRRAARRRRRRPRGRRCGRPRPRDRGRGRRQASSR